MSAASRVIRVAAMWGLGVLSVDLIPMWKGLLVVLCAAVIWALSFLQGEWDGKRGSQT